MLAMNATTGGHDMRMANLAGRATVVLPDGTGVDVERGDAEA